MMNEQVFLGSRPIVQREAVFYGRRPIVPRFGVGDFGLGVWPGDLLAYRQEWEPFIAAHLAQWRHLNDLFEGTDAAKQCPPGIFTDAQLASLDPTTRSFCASLALTRMYTSDTDPNGILAQWNAWRDKSSADVVAGAATMLKWHQDVVMRVGGPYKDDLVKLSKLWNVEVQLPDVPSFNEQQDVIARIEGAYVAAKGVLQIVGYAAKGTLEVAGNAALAVTQGLTDAAKQLPNVVSKLPWILFGVGVVVVGGALLIYAPRPPPRAAPAGARS